MKQTTRVRSGNPPGNSIIFIRNRNCVPSSGAISRWRDFLVPLARDVSSRPRPIEHRPKEAASILSDVAGENPSHAPSQYQRVASTVRHEKKWGNDHRSCTVAAVRCVECIRSVQVAAPAEGLSARSDHSSGGWGRMITASSVRPSRNSHGARVCVFTRQQLRRRMPLRRNGCQVRGPAFN